MKFIKTFESQHDSGIENIVEDLNFIFNDLDLEFNLSKERNPIFSEGSVKEGFSTKILLDSISDKPKMCSKLEECIKTAIEILPLEFAFCLIYYRSYHHHYRNCIKISDIRIEILNSDHQLQDVCIFFDYKE